MGNWFTKQESAGVRNMPEAIRTIINVGELRPHLCECLEKLARMANDADHVPAGDHTCAEFKQRLSDAGRHAGNIIGHLKEYEKFERSLEEAFLSDAKCGEAEGKAEVARLLNKIQGTCASIFSVVEGGELKEHLRKASAIREQLADILEEPHMHPLEVEESTKKLQRASQDLSKIAEEICGCLRQLSPQFEADRLVDFESKESLEMLGSQMFLCWHFYKARRTAGRGIPRDESSTAAQFESDIRALSLMKAGHAQVGRHRQSSINACQIVTKQLSSCKSLAIHCNDVEENAARFRAASAPSAADYDRIQSAMRTFETQKTPASLQKLIQQLEAYVEKFANFGCALDDLQKSVRNAGTASARGSTDTSQRASTPRRIWEFMKWLFLWPIRQFQSGGYKQMEPESASTINEGLTSSCLEKLDDLAASVRLSHEGIMHILLRCRDHYQCLTTAPRLPMAA